jgi:hypothetical protein
MEYHGATCGKKVRIAEQKGDKLKTTTKKPINCLTSDRTQSIELRRDVTLSDVGCTLSGVGSGELIGFLIPDSTQTIL